MGESRGSSRVESIAFESFGVRVRVSADEPEILGHISRLLPPDAKPCALEAAGVSFAILSEGDGSYRFERDDSAVSRGIDLDFALILIEGQLRIYVGLNAPGRIFVHAGVVASQGRAIVLPGLSFSGKTALVLALVRAGATYYSDEYAVLDEAGLVHPFAKPLSIRDHDQVQTDHPVGELGGVTGDKVLRIAAVAFAEYRPGAKWDPTPLSPARASMAMLQHTLSARERTAEALQAIRRAIDGAIVLQGERGEAGETAEELLALLTAPV